MKSNNLCYRLFFSLVFGLFFVVNVFAKHDSYSLELTKIPRKDFIKVHRQYINFVIEIEYSTKYSSFIENNFSWLPKFFEKFPNIISSCYAFSSEKCVFGGWPSKKRSNGICISPWKARKYAKKQKAQEYGPKCGASNLFRCNSTLFGPGPTKDQMTKLQLIDASGVGQNHNEQGGICIDTGGTYKGLTKKCAEMSTKLNSLRGKPWLEEMSDKDFKKYYKNKFEPLKKFVDSFCSLSAKSEIDLTCRSLNSKVNKILKNHRLRFIVKAANDLPIITNIKVKDQNCQTDMSSKFEQLPSLKDETKRSKNPNISKHNQSKEVDAHRKKPSGLSYCQNLDNKSCLYKSSNISYKNDTIVIYHRGFWGKYKGNVPKRLRKKSIQQVLAKYDLDKSSEKLRYPFLVSTSSNVGFTIEEIESAIKEINLKDNANVILVSHSGGYLGLIKTLKNLKKGLYNFKIEKIVMLDNFYFSSYSTSIFKDYFDRGVKCSGFYTSHNRKRLKDRLLKKIGSNVCSIEKRQGHNNSVNDCLVSYVSGVKCDSDD